MFKNREFRIRVHKTDPNEIDDTPTERELFEDKVALVHTIFKDIAKTVALGIVVYVVADTARQVAIDKTTN